MLNPLIMCNSGGGRSSNIELLRILAILLIVLSHYSQHGLMFFLDKMTFPQQFLSLNILTFGSLGVQIFVLITGFFMINSEIRVKSFIKTLFETLFYSYLIFVLFLIFAPGILNMKMITSSLLPVGSKHYWFITSYLMLYLFIPALNLIALKIKQKTYQIMLALMLFLWFFMKEIFGASYEYSGLTLFIGLYYTGGYIKLYGIKCFEKLLMRYLFILQFFVINFIFFYYKLCIGTSVIDPDVITKSWRIIFPFSPFMLLAAIGIFYIFKDLKIKNSSIINWCSVSVLSIYLITENICIRHFIWKDWFGLKNLFADGRCNLSGLFLNVLISLVISFAACIVIDKIRINLIEKPFLNFVDKKLPIKTIKL